MRGKPRTKPANRPVIVRAEIKVNPSNPPQPAVAKIQTTGTDNRMDWREMFEAINPLPVRCSTCGFPDIDFVPQPYFVNRSRAKNPNELSPANMGNLLVRDRARQILEAVCPGACMFYPTTIVRSSELTPWSLAMPNARIEIGVVSDKIPRCAVCDEPQSAHLGSQYQTRYDLRQDTLDADILKGSNWLSSEVAWSQWINRDLFLSVRLYQLLKRAKIKGLYATTPQSEIKPTAEDKEWIKEKFRLISTMGLIEEPSKAPDAATIQALHRAIANLASTGASSDEIAALEERCRCTLPPSYKEFISKVGTMTFSEVDSEEGTSVKILHPADVDVEEYRLGKIQAEDEDSLAVDGIMFADTGFGDSFSFDIAQPGPEYPIVKYMHEGDYFEPYANNFEQFILRVMGV